MKTFSVIIYGGQYVFIEVVLPLHESGVLVVGSVVNERPHIVVLKHRLKYTHKIIMSEGVSTIITYFKSPSKSNSGLTPPPPTFDKSMQMLRHIPPN